MGKQKTHDEDLDDPYDKESVEHMAEDEQLEPAEAGFMEGYQEPNLLKCIHCGKAVDPEKAFEVEEESADYLFCSEVCAKRFKVEKDVPKQDQYQ